MYSNKELEIQIFVTFGKTRFSCEAHFVHSHLAFVSGTLWHTSRSLVKNMQHKSNYVYTLEFSYSYTDNFELRKLGWGHTLPKQFFYINGLLRNKIIYLNVTYYCYKHIPHVGRNDIQLPPPFHPLEKEGQTGVPLIES